MGWHPGGRRHHLNFLLSRKWSLPTTPSTTSQPAILQVWERGSFVMCWSRAVLACCAAVWVPTLASQCLPHCMHSCAELNGDVKHECGACDSSSACNPENFDGVPTRATVSAQGEVRPPDYDEASRPCRPDFSSGQLNTAAKEKLPLLVGLHSCKDVLRLGLCSEPEGRVACATSCGFCNEAENGD